VVLVLAVLLGVVSVDVVSALSSSSSIRRLGIPHHIPKRHASKPQAGREELHYIVQYFLPNDKLRKTEIDICLLSNLFNKELDAIHILLEKEEDFPKDLIPQDRIAKLEDLAKTPPRKGPPPHGPRVYCCFCCGL